MTKLPNRVIVTTAALLLLVTGCGQSTDGEVVSVGAQPGEAISVEQSVSTTKPDNSAVTIAVKLTADATRARTGKSPSEADVYATTRAAALDAINAGRAPENEGLVSVFLITYTGDFTLNVFRGPVGAEPPRGKMLTYVVDASTGEILDIGVEEQAKDLSGKLGSPRRVRVSDS
jgi:hypothetical protein